MPTFVKTFKPHTIMTDKDKIELIIKEKGLNSTQFCNEVCIAPGTLSHIRNGRTEPSLNILRSITQAFPDINPAWLFYGEGEMYRDADDSSTGESTPSSGADNNINVDGESSSYASDTDMPVANQRPFVSCPDDVRLMRSPSTSSAPSVSSFQSSSRSSRAEAGMQGLSPFTLQDVVAETIRQQRLPQRKIVEVRIFFDDGTFETFSAKWSNISFVNN